MFESVSLGDSSVPYLVITGLVALDAMLPMAPSETLVVAAGVLVADGELAWALVLAAAAGGALAGHSILFALGRGAGGWLRRRFVVPEREQDLERAGELIRVRTWLLVVSDFIPVGRTAAMLAAGILRLPVRRFYEFVIPGALVWAAFWTLLGVAGGATFEKTWQALAASLAMALAIAAAGELALGLRSKRRPPR